MLIRHISVPRNAHLLPLSEPQQREEAEEGRDYATYLNRTLNPELPENDILVSPKTDSRNCYPEKLPR